MRHWSRRPTTDRFARSTPCSTGTRGVCFGSFDFWESLRSVLLVGGLLCGIVYFFFSFEHKGIVGRTAKVGIWVLMITFGAGFGYTVMGRIALLAIRLEFLLDDWLWLIDHTGMRG